MKASGDELLGAATRYSALRCTALALLTVASAGAALLLPYALARTLDAIFTAYAAGVMDSVGGEVGRWLLISAALLGGMTVLDSCEEILTGTTNARTTAWLRLRLLRHVLAAGPRTTARFPAGELLARLVGNTAQAGPAPATFAALLAALVAPLGAIVALALLHPWLAIVFLAGAPALALLLRSFARASSDCVAQYQRIQGDIAGRLTEAIGGARTVAAARTEEKEAGRILEPLPELARQGRRMWRIQGRASGGAVALAPLLQIAILVTAGHLVLEHRLTVGQLLATTRYAALATGVGVLVGHLAGLVRARAAGQRLGEVLSEPAPGHGSVEVLDGQGELKLRGISAHRDGRPVLDALDLTVPAGTTLAVVGVSGAGKSLLAAVAGRLTDPDAGTVLLDGVPLPDLTRAALRREIGYAFERPALLGGTLGGTIALGSDTSSRDDVVRAARAARADGFVRRLPQGYDTACLDAPLSGGEVQRLGLARAFTHGGRLLILDDAMSSLDMITEHEIADALLRHTPATTRLVVAHRATTAARADTVAWLDGGRIRALGPHAVLWRNPSYRAVFAGDGEGGDAGAGAGAAESEGEGGA
ncbi:ABC transporter ATP-binding protein [Streptomyces sp. NBC_01304]|uniref:ABC transporter ATP-binding protein n=1 Tax=Streptomyces sp. NBC_01304 TaxID=2903818 RepID=UPI002E0F3768|nr:ABC transporter ATP-binding protein/permease [Streptomyces sp. NBC_01304]